MNAATILITALAVTGAIGPPAATDDFYLDEDPLSGTFVGPSQTPLDEAAADWEDEIDLTALPAEERVSVRGTPVVNRLDDDGVYVTWSLILRHENGRLTLAYESGGNLDYLKRAYAAVEAARLLGQPVTVEGLAADQGAILLDRIDVGRETFITDQDDPLEDAVLEAEAAAALQPRLDLDAVPTRIAEVADARGQLIKVAGVPVANVFKHNNGQGVWNVLLSDNGATLLAYESGENIDQLNRLAALVDLAVAEKRQMAFIGRYDDQQQVLQLTALQTPDGICYLTDLGEAGAAAPQTQPRQPVVVRTVEPLFDELAEIPAYVAPGEDSSIEYEYLTPIYEETPVPVVIEREVVVEHHHYWVFPEIVLVVRGPWWHHRRPRWADDWRSWTFCPKWYFDRRWQDWRVRRHPAYFDFHLYFSWHRDRDDRDHRDRDRHDGRGAERERDRRPAPPAARGHREEIRRRALAYAQARRRAQEQDRQQPRPDRPRTAAPRASVVVRTPQPPPSRRVTEPRVLPQPPRVLPQPPAATPPHGRTRLSREEVDRRKTIDVRLPARPTPQPPVARPPAARPRDDAAEKPQPAPVRRRIVESVRERAPTPPKVLPQPKPPAITPRLERTRTSPDDALRRKTVDVRPPARPTINSAAEARRTELLEEQRRRLAELRAKTEPKRPKVLPRRQPEPEGPAPRRIEIPRPRVTPQPSARQPAGSRTAPSVRTKQPIRVTVPGTPKRRTEPPPAPARREVPPLIRRDTTPKPKPSAPKPTRPETNARRPRSEPPARAAAKKSTTPSAPRASRSSAAQRQRDLDARRKAAVEALRKAAQKRR